MVITRFAPSTTGQAHPGTLLSALLVWLHARARGGRAILRLEDLDRERCKPEHAQQLLEAMAWLGLTWDEVVVQSAQGLRHEAALDALAAQGRLYPCACTRARLKGGRPAPDGGWAYDNACRARALPPGGWRAAREPLRVRLTDDYVDVRDEGGADLGGTPARDFGDPVVRRKDGDVTYQLAVVVDDHAAGITEVVRGRDIAPSTATQVALYQLLGWAPPRYRHHFLLLEQPGEKLAKLHGSIPFAEVRAHYSASELLAWLAGIAGFAVAPAPVATMLGTLVAQFAWPKVRTEDVLVEWQAPRLRVVDLP